MKQFFFALKTLYFCSSGGFYLCSVEIFQPDIFKDGQKDISFILSSVNINKLEINTFEIIFVWKHAE